MAGTGALERGRASFAERAWDEAYARLSAADAESRLGPDDLELLARAAYLTGHDGACDEATARAHQAWLRAGDAPRAALCAFWLGFGHLMRGEGSQASGWLGRGQRLVDDGPLDCVARGYLLVPVALQVLDPDPVASHAAFARAGEIGERFADPDLVTLGRLGRGQALIRARKTAEGMALLDEAMVSVTADEVSPTVAGIVYCAVLSECQLIFDLRRAREWTAALTHWCDAQPGLVPYRGQCLVHRAELMQLHGDWPDALDEAELACQRLVGHPAAGEAHYQMAELHRLRGEFAAAEQAYREASRRGRVPQPGLALLRLAQGQADVAAAAMRGVLGEAGGAVVRGHLLGAHVEVMLAVGARVEARGATDELAQLADDLGAPSMMAAAAHAEGAVLLAEGAASAAAAALRRAWAAWRGLDAPYEAARARTLLGAACRELGDADGAAMELDAARWVFQQLGAVPDLGLVDKASERAVASAAGRLTARERQVLRLVAAGKSNRAIAADLVLSEKTVARHMSNILTKLDLPSRSAATAYAYEHDLL